MSGRTGLVVQVCAGLAVAMTLLGSLGQSVNAEDAPARVTPAAPVDGKLYVPDSGVDPGAVGVNKGGGGPASGGAGSSMPIDTSVTDGGGIVTHGGSSGVPAEEAARSDYPTMARADYVFACMQVNGQSRETLEKCACSLDVIASLLPFNEYEEAETILSVRQRGGKAQQMLDSGAFKDKVKTMKRAQVEGELRCF